MFFGWFWWRQLAAGRCMNACSLRGWLRQTFLPMEQTWIERSNFHLRAGHFIAELFPHSRSRTHRNLSPFSPLPKKLCCWINLLAVILNRWDATAQFLCHFCFAANCIPCLWSKEEADWQQCLILTWLTTIFCLLLACSRTHWDVFLLSHLENRTWISHKDRKYRTNPLLPSRKSSTLTR